jgi:carbonic anhydrase
MKAVLSGDPLDDTPNLAKWLQHADCALERLKTEGPLDSTIPAYDQLSQLNVLVQIEHLLTYPIVQQQVAANRLQLSGWWFDIGKGEMLAFEPERHCFVMIDRMEGNRLFRIMNLDDDAPCCGSDS